jgi:hypothetical protein
MLVAISTSAQTTNYTETFDPIVPVTVTNFSMALGGLYDTNGINSNLTEIVYDFEIWGFTSNASFQAIGGTNGNVLQPQQDTKNNFRMAGTFIDPTNFNGVAGGYAINFDIIGADPGRGQVYVGQGSGYDLSGTTSNAIELDLASGGFATYGGLTAVGSAQVETLVNVELDEQTSANKTFLFQYDGSSALAIAFGGYNTGMQIDNIAIFPTNYTLPLVGASNVVMFGGKAAVLDDTVEINNAFVNQIGAGEIVQWNGVNSAGGSFGSVGTLQSQVAGATLTNTLNDLVLTSQFIASTDPARTNTYTTQFQLGIGTATSLANFQESAGTVWTFDFNRRVELKQIIFAGINAPANDHMRIIIDGVTNDIYSIQTEETDAWSGAANTEVYTFTNAVSVPAGADITVTTHPAGDPVNNKWGLYSVVVSVPDKTAAEFYAEWVADYVLGMSGLTNLTDDPDGDEVINLYEYALGGIPTNSGDLGIASEYSIVDDSGTSYFEYTHVQRDDAAARGLVYYLLTDGDLMLPPGWASASYAVGTNTGYGVDGYDVVTNRVPATDDQRFFKLQVELP